jgi:hypothetical protein
VAARTERIRLDSCARLAPKPYNRAAPSTVSVAVPAPVSKDSFEWYPKRSGELVTSVAVNLGEAGANYGWSMREGTYLVVHDNEHDVFALPPGDATLGFTYPVLHYDHDEDDHAISGGYVYRGTTIPELVGEYVFGDLVSGRIFHAPVSALDGTGQAVFEELRLIDATDQVEKSLLEIIGGDGPAPRADLRFGIDGAGEIYLVTKRDGKIRRLMSVRAVPALEGGALVALLLLVAAGAYRTLDRSRHSRQPSP